MTIEHHGEVQVGDKTFKFNDKSIEIHYRVGWLSGMLLPSMYNSIYTKKSKVRDLMGEIIEEIRKLGGDLDGCVDTNIIESRIISTMIEINEMFDAVKLDFDKIYEGANTIHLEMEEKARMENVINA